MHNVTNDYKNSEQITIPTEMYFSTETQRTLGHINLLTLTTQPNNDKYYLLSTSTTYVTPPKRTYDNNTTKPKIHLPKTPLNDQLFIAHLIQFLRHLDHNLPSTNTPNEIQTIMHKALWELFNNTSPPNPEINVKINANEQNLNIILTIHPHNYLNIQMEEISLNIPLK